MRNRRFYSVKKELVAKSKEAQLAAISIFNNPLFNFKTETFIVLSIISWTYLFLAFFRNQRIDSRFIETNIKGRKKIYKRTKNGALKYWDLETSLTKIGEKVDQDTKNNLRFLIGLRHEIEHQMTTSIDDLISARLQASVFNYNQYLVNWFGLEQSLEKQLSFSIQLSHISLEQVESLKDFKDVPSSIHQFIEKFDGTLSSEQINNPHFAYRVFFQKKLVNHAGQADSVVNFIKAESSTHTHPSMTVVTKEVDKKKYIPSEIVNMMKIDYPWFNITCHTRLWQKNDAKNPTKGFGSIILGNQWGWNQSWLDFVKEFCKKHDLVNHPK